MRFAILALALVSTTAVAGPAGAGSASPEPTDETPSEAPTAPATEPAGDSKPTPKVAPAAEAETKHYELSGYIQPSFRVLYRGDAVPRDRWKAGAEATRAGVEIDGEPITGWKYEMELIVAGESNDLVSSVGIVDLNGDGVPDNLATTTQIVPQLFINRAIVDYVVNPHFEIIAGQERIPFTIQEQNPSTDLMFPTRSGPNEIFVQGPDLGGEIRYRTPSDQLVVQLGAFNGTGEPVSVNEARGLVYLARIDVNPLGALPLGESAPGRSAFRLGLGAGLLYYGSRHYDAAGFPGSDQRDFRASATLRIAGGGLYVQAEALRRQRTDSLSARPEITTGAYSQASWYVPARVGIAPLIRLAWAAEDQGGTTRTTLWLETGLAIHPKPSDPEAVRIIVEYIGERRVTEAEQAHGAVVQAQLTW